MTANRKPQTTNHQSDGRRQAMWLMYPMTLEQKQFHEASVSKLPTVHSEAASPPSIWTLLWNTDGYGDGAPAAPALGEQTPRHRIRRGSAADGCIYPFRTRMLWTRDDGDKDEDEDEDSADTGTHANSQPPTAALPSIRRGVRPTGFPALCKVTFAWSGLQRHHAGLGSDCSCGLRAACFLLPTLARLSSRTNRLVFHWVQLTSRADAAAHLPAQSRPPTHATLAGQTRQRAAFFSSFLSALFVLRPEFTRLVLSYPVLSSKVNTDLLWHAETKLVSPQLTEADICHRSFFSSRMRWVHRRGGGYPVRTVDTDTNIPGPILVSFPRADFASASASLPFLPIHVRQGGFLPSRISFDTPYKLDTEHDAFISICGQPDIPGSCSYERTLSQKSSSSLTVWTIACLPRSGICLRPALVKVNRLVTEIQASLVPPKHHLFTTNRFMNCLMIHRKMYLSQKHLRQPKPAAYELPQYRRHIGDVQVCFRSCTCRRREKENRACDQSCHLYPYLCLTMLTIRSQQQTRTADATAENLALDPISTGQFRYQPPALTLITKSDPSPSKVLTEPVDAVMLARTAGVGRVQTLDLLVPEASPRYRRIQTWDDDWEPLRQYRNDTPLGAGRFAQSEVSRRYPPRTNAHILQPSLGLSTPLSLLQTAVFTLPEPPPNLSRWWLVVGFLLIHCICSSGPFSRPGDRGPPCKQGLPWFSPNSFRSTSTSRDETPGPVASTSLSYLRRVHSSYFHDGFEDCFIHVSTRLSAEPLSHQPRARSSLPGRTPQEARSHEILALLAFRNKVSSLMPHHVSSRLRQHGPVQHALAQLLSGAHSVFAIPSSAVFAVPVGKSMKTPFLRSTSLVGRPLSPVFELAVLANGQHLRGPMIRAESGQHPADKLIAFLTSPVSSCFFPSAFVTIEDGFAVTPRAEALMSRTHEIEFLANNFIIYHFSTAVILLERNDVSRRSTSEANILSKNLRTTISKIRLSTALSMPSHCMDKGNETPRFPLSVPHARIESKHDVEIEAIQSDNSPPFRDGQPNHTRPRETDVRETDKLYGQADMVAVLMIHMHSSETKVWDGLPAQFNAHRSASGGYKIVWFQTLFQSTECPKEVRGCVYQKCCNSALRPLPACLPGCVDSVSHHTRRGGNRSHELRVAILKHARRNGTPLDPKAITRRCYISPDGLGMINSCRKQRPRNTRKRARRLPRPFGGITTELSQSRLPNFVNTVGPFPPSQAQHLNTKHDIKIERYQLPKHNGAQPLDLA
ncbi:uncharacterized protein CLUP02_10322 [Colletotrichum lupini]|uniref:Uncharacterized protein n=1 Tax=Colletotrichum lupini TaxID=145971 RepID=A0A9Q8SWH0_9PEZI|nr:uncharacterized protein CLUP02_10322 [Colletotrichum lupini]UQC84826.1 hypothetical protein CLUP02_10322 [Colletotrichum lupini]